MDRKDRIGTNLVKIASIYMMVGLAVGLYVAISKQFALATVHSHILLLGWSTMAITALVYIAAPDCAGNKLARAHFWLHNAGLPLMMASLAIYEYDNARAELFVGIGSVIVFLSLLLFVINVFKHFKTA